MGCVNSAAVMDNHDLDLVQPLSCSGGAAQSAKKFHAEYHLKAKLGKGAFAQVHLARKASDGSAVAVKITDLRSSSNDAACEEVDARLRRTTEKEASILARVGEAGGDGGHCVRFFEAYLEGTLSYIVMERCDMTLLHALERAPELTERTYVHFFRQMLTALCQIHQRGVVHRDVKPDNFLCTGKDNTVKLCDFGLAEVLRSPSSELKGVYGTAPFMSPEMLSSEGYGAATDVWSFGVIAYVLLFGQFPYTPIEVTAKAMKAAILSGVPQPAFKAKASLDSGAHAPSPEFMEALRAMLQRAKASRLSAADALELPWLSEAADESKWNMPSLRPMLCAAKRVGAFDVRGNSHSANEKPSGVDMLLRVEQERRARASSKENIERAHSESSLNKAVHRHDKLDATMVQSGGAMSGTSHLSTSTGTSATSFHSKSSKPWPRSAGAGRDA